MVDAGYAGNSCATDIDECASSPCSNAGTCAGQVDLGGTPVPDAYTCTCAMGWAGNNCITESDANSMLAGPCLGDVDGNGQIHMPDLLYVLASFGAPAPVCNTIGCMDWDDSGEVDVEDLLVVLQYFGTTCE